MPPSQTEALVCTTPTARRSEGECSGKRGRITRDKMSMSSPTANSAVPWAVSPAGDAPIHRGASISSLACVVLSPTL